MTCSLAGRFTGMMLALSCVIAGQKLPGLVEIVPASIVNQTFPVLRNGHPGNIELRSLQLLTHEGGPYLGKGSIESRSPQPVVQEGGLYELLLFRDPSTGRVVSAVRLLRNRYGTFAEAGEFLQNTAVSIDKGAMRAFFFTGYGLLISESTTRAASLDAAQEPAISHFLALGQRNWWAPGEHWIQLVELLPKSLVSHAAELRAPPTHLRELARSGRCWSMALDAPGAEITRIAVDESYDLASIESCAKPSRPIAHIILPRTETTLQVPALRNNQPITLEMGTMLAQVTFPDGQIGRLHLFMLYDRRSRLFWWTCWPLYRTQPDSVVETDNENFIGGSSVFVTDDRIAVFSGTSVSDSTEHYPNYETAKAHVVSVLDKIRGDIQAGFNGGLPYRALNGIPNGFFYQCGHAEMAYPQLKRVEKIATGWRLSFTGANGNSAVLSLRNNFEAADVELSGSTNCGY